VGGGRETTRAVGASVAVEARMMTVFGDGIKEGEASVRERAAAAGIMEEGAARGLAKRSAVTRERESAGNAPDIAVPSDRDAARVRACRTSTSVAE
jgi:hypothetical protein